MKRYQKILKRFMGHLIPNAGTILIILVLLWVQGAGAQESPEMADDACVSPIPVGGTVCLSDHVTINLPAGSHKDVPGLNLAFESKNKNQALVWIDGLAKFTGQNGKEFVVNLKLDGRNITGDLSYVHPRWFNVHGMRLVGLAPGEHILQAEVFSPQSSGQATVHGIGDYKTCINYLILNNSIASVDVWE